MNPRGEEHDDSGSESEHPPEHLDEEGKRRWRKTESMKRARLRDKAEKMQAQGLVPDFKVPRLRRVTATTKYNTEQEREEAQKEAGRAWWKRKHEDVVRIRGEREEAGLLQPRVRKGALVGKTVPEKLRFRRDFLEAPGRTSEAKMRAMEEDEADDRGQSNPSAQRGNSLEVTQGMEALNIRPTAGGIPGQTGFRQGGTGAGYSYGSQG